MSRHALIHTHHRPLRATALPERGSRAPSAEAAMAERVAALLESLPAEERRLAQRAFDDVERFNWHYVPRARAGLPIRAMGKRAGRALTDLLHYALSDAGFDKAKGIMGLEEPLGLIEGRPQYRDPRNYSVTVFGEPGCGCWGWRIEGHHLSLNFTAVDEDVLAVAPAFWGSNPARVPDGYPMAGHRVLGRETDLAYGLIRGLEGASRERAIIAAGSLGNIITGPGREHLLQEREGLPLSAMPASLRDLALELLCTYARNLRGELAEREISRVREAGIEDVHFAWGGALESGRAHYWRLHGPITLIEFDNTQNNANHIHSVWHDLRHEFGGDLLRHHYEHGPHGHG
jgi:Protein of unknown function (DUF3500)